MDPYKLKLTLRSPALVGSGEGFGAIIDSDIVFDAETGIPYIPAKRIKGCLLTAAREVEAMFKAAKIPLNLGIEKTFGTKGASNGASVYFSTLVIKQYDENRQWLMYLLARDEYKNIISRDAILETFTEIRQQTRIDKDGTASVGSLRTSRVIKQGMVFWGDILVATSDQAVLNTLELACRNFRSFGTQRNRGYGEITCEFMKATKPIDTAKMELEGICIT